MTVTLEDVSRISGIMMRLVNKYKRLDTRARDYGTGDLLYSSEIHVIEAIGNHSGNTVNEISEKFGVTKGAISQIVNKLVKKGLVKKSRNPEFYKEIILTLTENGTKVLEGHLRLHSLMDQELLKFSFDFNNEDMKKLESFLIIIEDQIEKYLKY